MDILISNSSDKPIYEQICLQIKGLIMDGTLQPGEMLPSMRGLAKDLHISVITVHLSKQYPEKEALFQRRTKISFRKNSCESQKNCSKKQL